MKSIVLFEHSPVRRIWVEAEEKWYFSVIDVVAILSGTDRPRKYWSDLKTQLNKEGSELSGKIGQLKLMDKLTDYWKNHDVKEQSDYAMLTNIIHKEWSGIFA